MRVPALYPLLSIEQAVFAAPALPLLREHRGRGRRLGAGRAAIAPLPLDRHAAVRFPAEGEPGAEHREPDLGQQDEDSEEGGRLPRGHCTTRERMGRPRLDTHARADAGSIRSL